MKKGFTLIAVILVVFGGVVGGLFGKLPIISADSSTTPEKIVSDYTEALSVIDKNYVGKVDHEKITDSLDPEHALDARPALVLLHPRRIPKTLRRAVLAILRHRRLDPPAPRRRVCSISNSKHAGRKGGSSVRRSLFDS